MKRFSFATLISFGYRTEYPQRRLMVGYLAYSLLGALLLSLPLCSNSGVAIIDNLFTAVSALSTTGLATIDIAADYSFWGQLVVLLLIQLGGLGYMTFTSYAMLRLTRHLGTDEARLFHAQFAFPDREENDGMVSNIVNFALALELLGIVALYPYFLVNDVDSPLWSAIFHSISAFCTAGFSIYSDNLMQFRADWYVNVVIATLSYMGAMGFIMMTDVMRKLRHRSYRISFTTKVIATITTIFTLWSTLHLFFFEPSMHGLATGERLLAAWFQSMSAITTVGFNTVDVSQLCAVAMIVLSFSMYIGASPSGTGGGLKSTTLSAVLAYTKNKLGLRHDISLAGNKIPAYRIDSALTTTVFYTIILATGIYLLTIFEGTGQSFLDITFEATSALATAGLSSGILPAVGTGGKMVLIVLMFIGRVGVITLGNVMLVRANTQAARHRSDLVV